jgi:G6PDH family F420-dependent oxidoreductase
VMIAVEPEQELCEMFDQAGGKGKPRVGQIAVAYDADRDAAVKRAHEQFRWFGLGWKVNADLPNPDAFEGATQFVTAEQVSEQLACGADVEEHVQKIESFLEAGFDQVALVQIGGDQQQQFIKWAERELLPALRAL